MTDCQSCGACCRGTRHNVEIHGETKIPTHLTVLRGTFRTMLRINDDCAALLGVAPGRVECSVYGDRPRACRDFELGSPQCIDARSAQGLT